MLAHASEVQGYYTTDLDVINKQDFDRRPYAATDITHSKSFEAISTKSAVGSRRMTRQLADGVGFDPFGYALAAVNSPFDAALSELDSTPQLSSSSTPTDSTASPSPTIPISSSSRESSGLRELGATEAIQKDTQLNKCDVATLSDSLVSRLNHVALKAGPTNSKPAPKSSSPLTMPADADFKVSKLYLRTVAAQKLMEKERARAKAKGEMWKEDVKVEQDEVRRWKNSSMTSYTFRTTSRSPSLSSGHSTGRSSYFDPSPSRSDSQLPLPPWPNPSIPTLASIRSRSFIDHPSPPSPPRLPLSPPPPVPLPFILPVLSLPLAEHKVEVQEIIVRPSKSMRNLFGLFNTSSDHVQPARQQKKSPVPTCPLPSLPHSSSSPSLPLQVYNSSSSPVDTTRGRRNSMFSKLSWKKSISAEDVPGLPLSSRRVAVSSMNAT